MHHALHAVILCIVLWSVQGGGNVAKTVANPEVLTIFAKNVASILSPILLNDYMSTPVNKLSMNHGAVTKNSRETIRTSNATSSSNTRNPKNLITMLTNRYSRNIRANRSFDTDRNKDEEHQDTYVKSSDSDNSKYRITELHKSYTLQSKRAAPIARDDVTVESFENVRKGSSNRGNLISRDLNAAPIQNTKHYRLPGFKYDPRSFAYNLANPGHYEHFGFDPHYHHHYNPYPNYDHSTAIPSAQPPATETEIVENNSASEQQSPARTSNRPYNFDYNGQYYPPYQPPFYRNPGPNKRPNEGNEEPENEQADQVPRQPPFREYGYDYRDPYRPGYHDTFYRPHLYYRPYHNFSTPPNPGESNNEDGGNNSTNNPGQPNYRGYGFDPYFPYHQGPYYHNFNGYPQAAPPQAPEIPDKGTENDQSNNNSTSVNGRSYGYPFKPFDGGFHDHRHPSLPFDLLPYDHFNHAKGIPYSNFYPGPHPYFPHSDPYHGGYYPYNNFYQPPGGPVNPSKPTESSNANSETSEAPVNSDAELVSESKFEEVRFPKSDQYENFYYPRTINFREPINKP